MKNFKWIHNLKVAFLNLEIKHKLLLSFFVMPIFLIISVGFISYLSSTRALWRQNNDIIYQYQQSRIAEMTRNKNRYELIASTITGNTTIQELISPTILSTVHEFDMVRTVLNPTLHSFLDASEAGMNIQLIRYNDMNSEIIFTNFEDLLNHRSWSGQDIAAGRRSYQLVNFSRIRDFDWVEDVMLEFVHGSGGVWRQVGYDRQYGNISYLHEIKDMSTLRNEAVGFLRITVTLEMIESEMVENGDGILNLVFDNQNQLLSTEQYKVEFYEENQDIIHTIAKNDGSIIEHTNHSLTLLKSDPFGDSWYMISVFSTDVIAENLYLIRTITLLSILCAGLLLLLMVLKLSSSFSNRITMIATKLHHFSSGEPNVKITGLGQDEIGFLSNAFNNMSEQITTLIYDNYVSDIEKKDALLKALQAQINPHILYNSLSSIGRLAEIGETEEIINMVQALVSFYRLTLNRGQELLPIRDELYHLKAYLEIFRIRKGEMFEITFDIDRDILEYQTIKVILQPFVENIFEHAVKPDYSIINISIKLKNQNDDILFIIKDDGIGMAKEKLEQIFCEKTPLGYGIVNVNKRIKLQYGEKYGVNITSEPWCGTIVKILIPKIKV